jgi:hypothetical protein
MTTVSSIKSMDSPDSETACSVLLSRGRQASADTRDDSKAPWPARRKRQHPAHASGRSTTWTRQESAGVLQIESSYHAASVALRIGMLMLQVLRTAGMAALPLPRASRRPAASRWPPDGIRRDLDLGC